MQVVAGSQIIRVVWLTKLLVPVNSVELQEFVSKSLFCKRNCLNSLNFLVLIVPVDHVYEVQPNEFLHVSAHRLFHLLLRILIIILFTFCGSAPILTFSFSTIVLGVL